MTMPPRMVPLLEQDDFAHRRLADRLAGPVVDSGNGTDVAVGPLTDDEYLWEPVAARWSVRRHADGPGARATLLVGNGDWGRDATPAPHPVPPPFTTPAWRLSHLTELLALRTDHTDGTRSLTRDDLPVAGDAATAIAAFAAAADAWRAVPASTDEAALDTVGHSAYPYGSDPEDRFAEVMWWVNQELLHHGAETALLRDLRLHRGPAQPAA
ncbi:DinB family protein [Kitasatospora sp. NBC_01560]|uniref:DinB family protein n=1 Tax=Kitasatospora sp. NBC_01560 TaxID=2975965 RepID=UPI00386716F4